MRIKTKHISAALLMVLTSACFAQEQAEPSAGSPQADRPLAEMSVSDLLLTAQRLLAAGQYRSAVDALDAVLAQDERNLDALKMLADIYWKTENVKPALDAWLRIREIQPNDFEANYGLGRLYLRATSRQHRQALGYLKIAATVIPPGRPDLELGVLVALAEAFHGTGGADEAVETVERALRLDPNSFEAQKLLVTLRVERARKETDYERALEAANRLVEIAGNGLQEKGTDLERVLTLKTAYETKLEVLRAFREIIFVRDPAGQLTDRVLPGREPQAAEVMSQIVDVMLREADLDRMIKYFDILAFADRAVQYDGRSDPSTLMVLGLLQKQTGAYQKAADTFERLLALDPGNDAARRELEGLPRQPASPPATQPTTLAP